MRRTLAIGDVHGCIEELRELLDVAAYRPASDRLVFVGDLVDRGPDPAAVVRFVRELEAAGDVVVVMGNHEEKLVRWYTRVAEQRRGGKPNKMTPPPPERLAEWEAILPEDRDWLATRPVVADAAPGWTVVHAGFESVPDGRQRPEKMMRCRWVDAETGKMIALAEGAVAPDKQGVVWAERWGGPGHVVYGHAVHSLETPRIDRPAPDLECWGIDTGCCFGGRLTALALETRDVFQVRARRAYSSLRAGE